jgi:hypothetical protein
MRIASLLSLSFHMHLRLVGVHIVIITVAVFISAGSVSIVIAAFTAPRNGNSNLTKNSDRHHCPKVHYVPGRATSRAGRASCPSILADQSSPINPRRLTSPAFRGKLASEPAFRRITAGCRNKIWSRNLCRGPSSALTIRPLTLSVSLSGTFSPVFRPILRSI